MDLVSRVREYMKANNLRDLSFMDYGESTKVTYSFKDGYTTKERMAQ